MIQLFHYLIISKNRQINHGLKKQKYITAMCDHTKINGEKIPLVSICCLAYNHEFFIRKCIDGFLMQKTNFPIEILIHDDASTDKTADIIREYEAKYPDIIKPIYQVENQYPKVTWFSGTYQYPRAKGKYIASCEGDDYWTDPYKLQKQVDFLEENAEYGLVYTDFVAVNERSERIKKELRRRPIHPSGNVLPYLAKRNFIQTVTVLGRTSSLVNAIKATLCINDFNIIDYALFFEVAGLVKIYYFPEITAAYRILSESASHSTDIDKKLHFAENGGKILRYYNAKYDLGISEKKFKKRYLVNTLSIYSLYREKKKFMTFLFHSVRIMPELLFSPVVYYHLLFLFRKND